MTILEDVSNIKTSLNVLSLKKKIYWHTISIKFRKQNLFASLPMSKSFISVVKLFWKRILVNLQALFHIVLVTYLCRVMSVTKLTVPLKKIEFWKIGNRNVHEILHIYFRHMHNCFGITSPIKLDSSDFHVI